MSEEREVNSNHDYLQPCPFNDTNHSLEFFSKLCTNSSPHNWNYNGTFYACCYPVKIDYLSNFAGIWCIIVAILGASGNLLTLATIPWASRNKLFGLERCWNNATIFVLNLAFADLLYCLIDLPTYSLQYLNEYWPLGDFSCKLNATARYIGAFCAWMSLGMVAVSRCVSLTYPKTFKRICRGKRCYMVIASIWLYGLLMVLPSLTHSFGMFGYNKNIGKCDFIMLETDPVNPHTVFYGIAFLLPFIAVVVSYYIIWKTSRNSTIYLKRYGCEENKRQLQRRDKRMTWTILVLSLCFIFTVGPISLMNVIDSTMKEPHIHLAFFIIYWFQYTLNFFIYAARSEQYRKAYCCFIWCFLLRSSCSEHKIRVIPHNTIFYINTSNNDNNLNLDFKQFLQTIQPLGRPKPLPASDPKPKVVSFENGAYNLSIDYNVDLELNKSTVSYTGNVQLDSSGKRAIIILPGQLNETKIVSSETQSRVTRSANISRKKYKKNLNKQMSCPQYYSSTHDNFSHDDDNHADFSHDHHSHADWSHDPQFHDHYSIGYLSPTHYSQTEEHDRKISLSCSHDFMKSTDEYCSLEGEHSHDFITSTDEYCSLEGEHSHDFITSTDEYSSLEEQHQHKDKDKVKTRGKKQYSIKTMLKKDDIGCKRSRSQSF